MILKKLYNSLGGIDYMASKWKVKKDEVKEKEVENVGDPQTEEMTKEEESQINVYEIELRKACGQFLAQLTQISCVLAIPLPSVLEDADNYLTMIQKEPVQDKKE